MRVASPKPSATPLNPKCIAISSGMIPPTKRAKTIGSKVTIDERISVHLYFFVIVIFSFQVCNPEHDVLEHRGVELVVNKFALSLVANEVGFL